MFQLIARFILRNRVSLLVVIGVLTLIMGYFTSTVKFSYSPAPLLPQSDSLLLEQKRFTDQFGKGENIMVIGVTDSLFYNENHLAHWSSLKRNLLAIPGVQQVFSVTDIFDLHKNTEKKQFEFARVFPDSLTNQQQIDSLAARTSDLKFYKGLLFNDTTKTYLMIAVLDGSIITTKERIPFMAKIVSACEVYQDQSGNKLHYSGLPYIRVTIGEMVKAEMFMFIFLAVLVTALILFLLFRSFKIVLFSLLVVAISVIWAIGTMGILGYEITLLTAVIPTLVIVIGVPNSIHLLNKYHHEYSNHGNKIKALQRVIQKIGSATLLTNLTTAAGFGTFIVTNTKILVEFGIVASIDIMIVFCLSLVLIPAVFSFLPSPNTKNLKHLDNPGFRSAICSVVQTTLYKRRFVYTLTAVFAVIGLVGLSLVRSNGYMVDDIPHKNTVFVDLKYFEKNFAGVMPFDILIDTQKPKGVLGAGELSRINLLQNRLDSFPELSHPLSIVEAAKFARQAYYNGNPAYYSLPTSIDRAFVLSYLPKGKESGGNLLNRFVDSTSRYARIMYNVADIGTIKMSNLLSKVHDIVNDVYGESASQVKVLGSSVVATKGNQYLVHSLFSSLLLAIFLIALFMAWMFRKFKMVLFSILPNLLPLLLTAAAMGFLNISLKPSTVIVFSIAFGISIDNSIHFLAKYRQELVRNKGNIKASVIYAIQETGISLIYTSIVLFFGFGIFAASRFGGTVSLGILISLTLLFALFSNLFILPSILLSADRKSPKEPEYEPALEFTGGFDDDDDDLAIHQNGTNKTVASLAMEESVRS